MKPHMAIEKLGELKREADDPFVLFRSSESAESWKSRVRAVIARALGERSALVAKLDENTYGLSVWSSGTPESAWANAFAEGVRRACGYVDAAMYELELLAGDDDPIDERSFDPELWAHVKGLIDAEDWSKVGASVCIFVEDKVRTWAGLDGESFGKGLYGRVLADSGALRLGTKKGEWEGWRALGVGFAQAIGNVDRHRIQDRVDARRYALGVLGLGSLLLTQLRYEHGELIDEAETPR